VKINRFCLLVSALWVSRVFAELTVNQIYPINFVDVDGNTLSTAERRITVVVVTTRADVSKAQMVGDRIPDFCLGDPNYRMITVMNFQKQRNAATRAILRALIRQRLDSEGERLQSRYTARKIARSARQDVFAVPDFDGSIVRQLGLPFESPDFHVFVFGKNGALLRQWNEVPGAEELAAVLK
jgi:hypothetical protein